MGEMIQYNKMSTWCPQKRLQIIQTVITEFSVCTSMMLGVCFGFYFVKIACWKRFAYPGSPILLTCNFLVCNFLTRNSSPLQQNPRKTTRAILV